MKKASLIVIAIVVSCGLYAQDRVGLKGIYFGDQGVGGKIIPTSLGGIQGAIITSCLKDGRIYMLTFMPSEDGQRVSRVYDTAVEKLVNGLNNKFGTKMYKIKKNDYSDDYYYNDKFKSGGAQFSITISAEHNEFKDPTTELTLWFSDVALANLADQEEQAEANDDF